MRVQVPSLPPPGGLYVVGYPVVNLQPTGSLLDSIDERRWPQLATDQQVDAAIRRVKESPENASDEDFRLVRGAAQQAGERGRRAKAALGDDSGNWGFVS